MAIDFPSPSYSAAGVGGLAMQISPLGFVELSDEEFEVHGPRMIRYSNQAAFYLGHHWGYRKQAGEPQLTLNYCRLLSDFMTSFCFSRGVSFRAPKRFQHIVPALLDRVWSRDNNKGKLLWLIGNQGSIFGDVFVKVSYENAYFDPAGIMHPGRVRIILLNPAHCFPRWHPHDQGRMMEFKLKYKFWQTAPDGTRIPHTYVEIITDELIKEYLDDQLQDERPNPLGRIPVVHIANHPAQGSPWGLADLTPELISANREYNEKMTEVSDIINYHANPVTVVTGGKPPQLEKGPSKIWGVDNDKAKIYNLEGGFEGLQGAVQHLQTLKEFMFECAGVPLTALGQEQPISNTSGVALAVQYQTSMRHFDVKKITYGEGLKELNSLILLTLFQAEPETVQYDPETAGILEEPDQPLILDPMDPAVYDIDTEFESPLPVDIIVKLNEIQLKMALGLESRAGAMRDLGEEFPDEKLTELSQELIEDAKDAAALDILKSIVAAASIALTGIVPEGAGTEAAPPEQPPNADGSAPAPPPPPPAQQAAKGIALPDLGALLGEGNKNLAADIVTRAHGMLQSSRTDPERKPNQ